MKDEEDYCGPGLDNTRLSMRLTAGAGTRCMSLLSSSPNHILTLAHSLILQFSILVAAASTISFFSSSLHNVPALVSRVSLGC